MTARIKKSMVCAIAAAAVVIGSAISIAVSNAQTAYAENEAVSVPITEPEVNEGKYYLNGNTDSCYFNVVDNTLQLVITDDADMHELFDEMASMNPAFANVFVFDNWYSDEKEYWVSPKEFMINVLPYGVQIGWDVYYSELDGSMSSYVCADYVDENCFKYNMCTFSRVSLPITEPEINEGKYYLNGNTDSLYFELSGGQMQLITDDKNKMREFYDLQAAASENFTDIFDFDGWYKQVSEEWTAPYSYMIHTDIPLNTTHLAWNVQYDSDGNIVCYLCADYIDENTVDYNGCIFTRLTES